MDMIGLKDRLEKALLETAGVESIGEARNKALAYGDARVNGGSTSYELVSGEANVEVRVFVGGPTRTDVLWGNYRLVEILLAGGNNEIWVEIE